MSQARRFALLGPPASGKGTQGRLLAERLGIAYLSTGAELRRAIEEETKLGLQAKAFLDANQYIPDDLAIDMVQSWVGAHPGGWLLDGFPRSIPQAKAICGEGEFAISPLTSEDPLTIIHLEVSADALRGRVSTRRECGSCGASTTSAHQLCPKCGSSDLEARRDDSAAGFESRLKAYQTLTVPALEFLRSHTKVLTVDGNGSREEVAHAIAQQLN